MRLQEKEPEITSEEETTIETEQQIEFQHTLEDREAQSKSFQAGSKANYSELGHDFEWMFQYIHHLLGEIDPEKEKYGLPTLPEVSGDTAYGTFLIENNITAEERLILLLTLIPNYTPTLLNELKGTVYNRMQYPQLGGVLAGDEKNFWPTVETALFIISDGSLARRIENENYFTKGSRLIQNNWIAIEESQNDIPLCYHRILATEEFKSKVKGVAYRPDYSAGFPASYLTTKLEWSDLILPYQTRDELNEMKVWLKHGQTILQHPELGRKIKPGYRALFYGPPGTGKTLTASLLGKEFGKSVYRIDLSTLVSKWVGETGKNLKKTFDLAENKNWILFFDEADSVFGKRTKTNNSNDRYANQEVSYLLQRIEDFPGMIILASNLKGNMDEAFNRRFQSIVYYPLPDVETRLKLWEKALPTDFSLEEKIKLQKIAEKYEMAGGSIINVVRYTVMQALERESKQILNDDIIQGIIKENKKQGKIVD